MPASSGVAGFTKNTVRVRQAGHSRQKVRPSWGMRSRCPCFPQPMAVGVCSLHAAHVKWTLNRPGWRVSWSLPQWSQVGQARRLKRALLYWSTSSMVFRAESPESAMERTPHIPTPLAVLGNARGTGLGTGPMTPPVRQR